MWAGEVGCPVMRVVGVSRKLLPVVMKADEGSMLAHEVMLVV